MSEEVGGNDLRTCTQNVFFLLFSPLDRTVLWVKLPFIISLILTEDQGNYSSVYLMHYTFVNL